MLSDSYASLIVCLLSAAHNSVTFFSLFLLACTFSSRPRRCSCRCLPNSLSLLLYFVFFLLLLIGADRERDRSVCFMRAISAAKYAFGSEKCVHFLHCLSALAPLVLLLLTLRITVCLTVVLSDSLSQSGQNNLIWVQTLSAAAAEMGKVAGRIAA